MISHIFTRIIRKLLPYICPTIETRARICIIKTFNLIRFTVIVGRVVVIYLGDIFRAPFHAQIRRENSRAQRARCNSRIKIENATVRPFSTLDIVLYYSPAGSILISNIKCVHCTDQTAKYNISDKFATSRLCIAERKSGIKIRKRSTLGRIG